MARSSAASHRSTPKTSVPLAWRGGAGFVQHRSAEGLGSEMRQQEVRLVNVEHSRRGTARLLRHEERARQAAFPKDGIDRGVVVHEAVVERQVGSVLGQARLARHGRLDLREPYKREARLQPVQLPLEHVGRQGADRGKRRRRGVANVVIHRHQAAQAALMWTSESAASRRARLARYSGTIPLAKLSYRRRTASAEKSARL